MPGFPPSSLGWCEGIEGQRHRLYSWGDWDRDAASLTHGRGCRLCGKRWGWLYTTHRARLVDMEDPEAHAQALRNKRIVPNHPSRRR